MNDFRRRHRHRGVKSRAYAGYRELYIDSCRRGNMSTVVKYTHPDLHLDGRATSQRRIRKHFNRQMRMDRYNCFDDDDAHFQFEKLPIHIQLSIWKLLIPLDRLIHCLSRLDPWTPPFGYKVLHERFPSRFHIGDKSCRICLADKPDRYLRYFLVSKRWYYITAHLFYGKLKPT